MKFKRDFLMSKYGKFSFLFSLKAALKKEKCEKKGSSGEWPRNVSRLEEVVMASVCFPILRMRCLQVSSLTFCTKQLLLIKMVENVGYNDDSTIVCDINKECF